MSQSTFVQILACLPILGCRISHIIFMVLLYFILHCNYKIAIVYKAGFLPFFASIIYKKNNWYIIAEYLTLKIINFSTSINL